MLPSLAKLYAAVGLQTWIEMFDRGSQEFTPLMTRMIAQNVDALDLNSNSPGDAGLLLKQARQTGFKGKIWQIGGPSVDEIIQVGGPLAEGFLSLEVFDPDDSGFQKFIASYHAKWSGIMDGQAPLWNNAAKMLFEALRRAGSLDVDKVRDAVEHLDGYTPGLYGPVVWGGMATYGVNHQQLLPFWIAEVKGGRRPSSRPSIPRRADDRRQGDVLSPVILGQVLVNGLSLSAIYVLIALGFTLLFGIMRVVNFAHGAFAMLGSYALFYPMASLSCRTSWRVPPECRHCRRGVLGTRSPGLPLVLPEDAAKHDRVARAQPRDGVLGRVDLGRLPTLHPAGLRGVIQLGGLILPATG